MLRCFLHWSNADKKEKLCYLILLETVNHSKELKKWYERVEIDGFTLDLIQS